MAKLDFKTAFKYPFNRAKGLLNILWAIIPIIGWFAIMGYQVRLVREWIGGKFEELPTFDFGGDLKLGFFMFLKLIPLMICIGILSWILSQIGSLGSIIYTIIVVVCVPILVINLFKEGNLGASFDFEKISVVISNLGDYIFTLIMEFVLGAVFFILSFVLVGIPAGAFTKNIFLADFYRRNVE